MTQSRHGGPSSRAASLLVEPQSSTPAQRAPRTPSQSRHNTSPSQSRRPSLVNDERAPKAATRAREPMRTQDPTRTQAQTSQSRPAHAPTFAELGVPAPLVVALAAEGKTTAFPIQAATLADTLAGRDVLGRGRTGSGKTLAFSLPLVARLASGGAGKNKPHQPRALVLAPTRELATQIAGVIEPLAAAYKLRVTTVFGGVKQTRQETELKRGAAIVVACPGRLEDLMGQHIISLRDVAVTVIDEADLMADMGFLPAVTRILRATPAVGQRMLFSATLDNGVDRLVREFLADPIHHSVDPAESPVDRMTHHVFEVADAEAKKALITSLASGTGRRIVFFKTKHKAKRTAKQLTSAGIPTVDLQGNLSQNARDRNLAMFDSGEVRVLAATDVAARGVDIDGVELVIHADPPREHKEYLHRSGRTARAGRSGDVVTICLPAERRDLEAVLKKAKISVRPVRVSAASTQVAELIGEQAAKVAPAPQTPQNSGGKGGGRGARSAGRSGASGRAGGSGRGGRQGRRIDEGGAAGSAGAGRHGRPGRGQGRGGSASSGRRAAR